MADTIDIRVIGKDETSASLASVRDDLLGIGRVAGDVGAKLHGLKFDETAGRWRSASGQFASSGELAAAGIHRVGDEAERSHGLLGSLGGVVGTLGKVALGVAGGGLLALGGALVSGIGDARQAAQIMAQTESVIKSTGGAAGVTAQQVADYAASLSAASGASLFGDDQIQQSENLLLTFTNIKDKTLEAATAISVDMAQALGGEPQSQAIQLGKALNDPIQGISALTRVGVTFTDEQKAQIKTMQEAGDMAGAQGVILAELNKEFGGSAEAAAKADGGWAQFSDRLGELGESVGAAVLPLLGEVVGFLNDTLMPALEQIGPIVGEVIAIFSQAGDSGGALGGALGELGAQLGITGGDFQALWGAVQNVVGSIQGLIEAVLPHLQQLWAEHGATVLALIGNSFHAVLTVVTTVLNLLAGLIKTITQAINGDWAGAWETLKQTAADFVLGILEVARTALDSLARLFGSTADDIIAAFAALPGEMVSIGSDIIGGVVDGVRGAAGQLFSTLRSIAEDALEAAKDAIGIGSPSKLFADEMGKPIVQGILEGMLATIPDLMSLVDEMGRSLGDKVADLAGSIHGTLADMFDVSADIDRQLAKNIEAVSRLASSMQAAVQSELDQAMAEAQQFQDPEQAAKFFKLRSSQILELAKMEDDVRKANAEGDYQRGSDLARQIELIKSAQEAERKAFGERAIGQEPFGTPLIEQIGKLFDAGVLGEGTPDALRIANQTLNTLLGQLFGLSQPGGGVSLPGPGMNAMIASGTSSGPGGGLTVIVNGAPGQSEQTIADKVIAEIERRYRGRP